MNEGVRACSQAYILPGAAGDLYISKSWPPLPTPVRIRPEARIKENGRPVDLP